MTFTTLGDKQNPAILLIHGMISSAADCEPFGRYLADRYYVIMPTLDGHGHDGTDLLPLEGEVEKLVGYLKENGIPSLAMVQGSSMGAEIALAVAKKLEQENIPFACGFFDGGPFFHFNPVFRAFMHRKFTTLVKIFDTDDHEAAYRKMMNHPFFKFVAKDRAEQFEPLIRSITSERRHYSKKTVRNLVEICYKCDLPTFGTEVQKRLLFFFSDEEPARKSRKRLMKAYPEAQYRDIQGYAHCGYQTVEPEKYAEILRQTIESAGINGNLLKLP